MIREANFLDIPDVVKIGRELYESAINHNSMYEFDDEKALTVCKHFIDSDDSIVLIDKNGGEITGFFIGQLTTPLVGTETIAVDVMLFVRPEYQGGYTIFKLIKKYEQWAKSKGAKFIQLGVSSGLKQQRTLSMYSYLGYRPHSAIYFKEVK